MHARIAILAVLLWTLGSRSAIAATPAQRLVEAAIRQTTQHVIYDGSYRRIGYPGGDVPSDRGVCSDVIVRAYRALGVDLQPLLHEDMAAAFAAYPKLWKMTQPDANIDHRRVPNLQTYFRRRRAELKVDPSADTYRAGDLVTWMLPGNLPHIGIVTNRYSNDGARPLIVHNIGHGPELKDALFAYPITGHYRFFEVD